MDIPESLNMDYIDEQYRLWRDRPDSVPKDWQYFFEGFERARSDSKKTGVWDQEALLKQSRVNRLVHAYRDLGHLLACMDPLESCPTEHPLLALTNFNLDNDDLDRTFLVENKQKLQNLALKKIIQELKDTYCRSIGVEYMHLQDPSEREWLQARMEPVRNHPVFDGEDKKRILKKLQEAALFEQFLNRKYVAVTRFSLEGGDVLIPMMDALIDSAGRAGVREMILGMAHRGRLNVQCNILGKPLHDLFSEFEHCYDPDSLVGSGDVKYHNGYLARVKTRSGDDFRIYLMNNPSHLESVDPVVEGAARGRRELAGASSEKRVMPLLVHGDAAFSGQGVVFETLNMSQLEGFRNNGTIHIVINNQIGYTTVPKDARSTRYATDVAKMLMAPIFHVHGEDPEAAVHVTRLAFDYRLKFKKDVVIDLVCYRRYGHNEGDEPYFTQPKMYDRIRERKPPFEMYAEDLRKNGDVDRSIIEENETRMKESLEQAYDDIHGSACTFPEPGYFENWANYTGHYEKEAIRSGVAADRLIGLAQKLNTTPDDFSLNEKLSKLLQKRFENVEKGFGIDWANAEALAFGSLLLDGFPIRLTGQDSARGTFSQRHSVLMDVKNGESYVPLNHLKDDQALFRVYNSLLSEYAVLGFEYGYSIVRPETLTIWEAQFGDFINNAQSIVDLFIASGQDKWQRLSGLVLLLPHGYEGLGPEHSSARPERFLQLCANDNIQVCNPTTPAQYFHVLRRQMLRKVRKPLVILTPKSLLRHPKAVSDLQDLTEGGFQEVLDEPESPEGVEQVVFCSGKIFYELLARRENENKKDVALLRIEQLYPFPKDRIEKVIGKYDKAKNWCWVQEEPENMGAWRFMQPRMEELIGTPVTYIGRPESASPATGFPGIYKKQQAAIAEQAIAQGPRKVVQVS